MILQFLDFNGLYGQDSHEYYRYSKNLSQYFFGTENLTWFYWPRFYPFLGSVFGTIGVPNDLALQLISSLSWFGIVFIISRHWIKPARYKVSLPLVLIAFTPYMVKGSVVVMSDMLAALFILSAWTVFYKHRQPESKWSFLIVVLLGCMATYTRVVAPILIFVPVVLIGYRTMIKHILYFAIGLVAMAPLVYFFIELHSELFELVGSNSVFHNWSPSHLFSNQFEVNSIRQYDLPNIVYILFPLIHPGFMSIGILALLGAKGLKLKKHHMPLLITITLYLLFIGGLPIQNNRFFLVVFPLFIILLAEPLLSLERYLQNKKLYIATTCLTIALQTCLIFLALKTNVKMNKIEKHIAEQLDSTINRKVFAAGWDVGLNSYLENCKAKSLFTSSITEIESGDYLLYNSETFNALYKGSSAESNYNAILEKFKLEQKQQFSNGLTLYELR